MHWFGQASKRRLGESYEKDIIQTYICGWKSHRQENLTELGVGPRDMATVSNSGTRTGSTFPADGRASTASGRDAVRSLASLLCSYRTIAEQA